MINYKPLIQHLSLIWELRLVTLINSRYHLERTVQSVYYTEAALGCVGADGRHLA